MKTLGAAVLLLAAGCGRRADAPLLRGIYDPSRFDVAGFEWDHPPGEATGGYALEVRIVPQPFQVASKTSPSELRTTYLFNAPEQLDFEFRVRALPDDDGSRASNVFAIRRGIRPPSLSCCNVGYCSCVPTNGAFELNWTVMSKVADAIRLERRVVSPFTPSYWVTLPVAYPATSYRDTDLAPWTRGTYFEYRLTTSKAAEQSPSVSVYTALLPL